MIVNKNCNQSQALKLVCLHIFYFCLLFHRLREPANAVFLFMFTFAKTIVV